ncbi:MAG: hypothetical protein JWR69_1938 [Pedosphaera sp.]|nr:hypothetical protein [Pedosphaera sp.]
MKTKLSLLLLSMALLAGCATDKPKVGEERTAPTDPGRVALLFNRPERAYAELGTVSTLKVQPDRGQTWQNVLRKQGGWLGADAVVVDTATLNNPTTTFVNGVAIRYKP